MLESAMAAFKICLSTFAEKVEVKADSGSGAV